MLLRYVHIYASSVDVFPITASATEISVWAQGHPNPGDKCFHVCWQSFIQPSLTSNLSKTFVNAIARSPSCLISRASNARMPLSCWFDQSAFASVITIFSVFFMKKSSSEGPGLDCWLRNVVASLKRQHNLSPAVTNSRPCRHERTLLPVFWKKSKNMMIDT